MTNNQLAMVGLPVVGYFALRPLESPWLRGGLATAGSAALLAYTSKDLAVGSMGTMMTVSLSWMTSIRFINLMTLPDDQRLSMSFLDYAKSFFFFFCPAYRNKESPRPLLTLLKDTFLELVLTAGKLVLTESLRDWLVQNLLAKEAAAAAGGVSNVSGGELVAREGFLKFMGYTAMFGAVVITGTFLNDLLLMLVPLVTGDRYRALPFNDWVILSESPREFWGKRYNNVVGTLLRESVFTPLRQQVGLAPSSAALWTFAVSGALHVHVAQCAFGQGMGRSFVFFILHGLACALEAKHSARWRSLPLALRRVLTLSFVVATCPLYLGLFLQASPNWLIHNPPPFTLPPSLKLPLQGLAW